MFAQPPRSAKLSKGLEFSSLQGVTKIVLLGFESVPLTSCFVDEFPQELDLIFELDEAAVGCTRDILRQSDCLDRLSEIPWVVPNFIVIEGEVCRYSFAVLLAESIEQGIVSYALSWKPYQGDSLNLPDHRIHKDGDGDALFQLKSDSSPHAHAQTTKTYYKHQDSRIMKAQELKTKTFTQTLIYKIFLQRYQVYQGRLLASFQDDAKYEHVGPDTRSQGGKDDQDGRIKI
ncbi:hypothetical protein Tco_1055784 [Tanacetum coccineum]|uniref:Uncharacterized protein n=1 Tax=Tanacetum coccineum TaxID=301880 RepID=A0ABQ5H2K7_9ASTR